MQSNPLSEHWPVSMYSLMQFLRRGDADVTFMFSLDSLNSRKSQSLAFGCLPVLECYELYTSTLYSVQSSLSCL